MPGLVFGPEAASLGFILYFPFHMWLTMSLFLVVFSRDERTKHLGPGYSFFGGFFAFIFARKFGLFCISWFYTTMLVMWLLGAI